MLALGTANVGASLLHGFPVSSSASRTAIGVATGSRTQLYSLTAAHAVAGVLLFARPVLAHFPAAALGAIVIYAALRLIDIKAFRRLFAFRRTELAIALATCVGVLGLNILYGVLVAVGLSVADLLVRVARPHDAVLGLVPGLAGMHDVDDYPARRPSPGWWCTATTRRCSSPTPRTSAAGRCAPPAWAPGPLRWFVLNVEANVEVDFTALEALDAVREEITRQGAVFALARVKQDLLARLRSFGLAEEIGEERLFPTLPTAVRAYQAWAREQDQPGHDGTDDS